MNWETLPLSRIQRGGESLQRAFAVGVREGPRVECGCPRETSGGAGTSGRVWIQDRTRGFPLGPAMGQPVCRVCFSLETLLMRWNTCQDLYKSQNLNTIDAPHSFDCRSRGRGIRRAKLVGAFKYLLVLLKAYTSEDLIH